MSIADEINRIKTNIANAYKSAEAKEATIPEIKNSENLSKTIESIKNTESFNINDYLNTIPDQNASGSASIVTLNIKKLPAMDFSKLTSARYLFSYCKLLTEVMGEVDIGFSGNNTGMFGSNAASSPNLLETIKIKNLSADLDLHYCTNLTKESLVYLLENAKTVNSGTINLGITNRLKLTEQEIDVATSKGWTIT